MKLALCTLSFLMFAAVCSAEGPFDGTWNGLVVRAAPPNQELVITITTDQGKVKGSLVIVGTPGEQPLEWGMTKGDLITFKVKQPFQTGVQTFVYLGRIEGDKILFGRRPEDQTLGTLVELTATKAK